LVLVLALLLLAYTTVGLRRARAAMVHAINTDALTGLNNRRRLMTDLQAGLAAATESDPLLLILCDLNGFKTYNDTFGHPAGDELLRRLGAALAAAVGDRAHAYRIGGDEFCVLARSTADDLDALLARVSEALTDRGDGFHITASSGAILLPAATRDPAEALRLVDQRMYADKNASRARGDNPSDLLMRALDAASPQLTARLSRVAQLTEDVCRRLGLPEADAKRTRQAAYLHDIGKVALPDEVLGKPGPLDPAERRFVEQSPVIGERIASVAPTLAPLSGLLRSARERFDGSGYPDRLAGDDIPLGARVIAACAAYVAMVSDRPYAPRRGHAEALAELRRHAGTQFDPVIVDAMVEVMAADPDADRRPVGRG
jgi:diguanylate cyclase (GGDEF)-like protein